MIMGEKPNLLVTSSHVKGRLDGVTPYAKVYWLDDLDDKELDRLAPVD